MDTFNGQVLGGNNTTKAVISLGTLIIVGVLIVTWINSKKAKKNTKGRAYCPER